MNASRFLTALVLALTSLPSAFAMNAAEEAAFYASKNYEALYTNDDGRVTIGGPKFGSADGTVRWISTSSNLNGVCELFGYGAAVASSLTWDGDFDRTIVIDSDARFSAFRSRGYNYNNSRIATIMCETGVQAGPSTRLEKPVIVNDDGTVTLVGPAFGAADGTVRWMSTSSNLNGVCKSFGFQSAIPASLTWDGDFDRTIILGGDAKFSAYRSRGYNYNNSRIKTLMCNP
ncbi:MAG: hypothetical protein JST04_09555 [Bdellovibrionales bacterium]|nr:hypothetical protein [Bdellovibrionales bacterium]